MNSDDDDHDGVVGVVGIGGVDGVDVVDVDHDGFFDDDFFDHHDVNDI